MDSNAFSFGEAEADDEEPKMASSVASAPSVATTAPGVPHGRDRFEHWSHKELEKLRLDRVKTEAKMKQLETERVKKDKLLTGKSESFVKQFKAKMSTDSEDPRVFRRNVDLLAEDVASALKERKKVVVIVYGHQDVAKVETDPAAEFVQSMLQSLRQPINMAARQHEMRIENDDKAAERARLITFAEETERDQQRIQAEEASADKKRGKTIGRQTSSFKRKSETPRGVVIKDDPAGDGHIPKPRSVKRLSLMQRQSISQENTEMNKILPAPQLEKVDLEHLRKVPVETEPTPPPKLDPILSTKSSSRRSLVARPSVAGSAKRSASVSGVTSLNKNGKKGVLSCVHFNGTNSFVKLPQLPGLAPWINSCDIDFWIKTDERERPMTVLWIGDSDTAVATLSITLNENHKQEPASGVTTFYLRDQSSNVFCATTHEINTDGRWRHVCFSIESLKENLVHLNVDGVDVRMTIKMAESPQFFPSWQQNSLVGMEGHGLLGATPGEQGSKYLVGAMMDLRIASFESKSTLRSHWELTEPNAADSPASSLQDTLGGLPAEVHNPQYKLEEFPQTSLFFNGKSTHVNLGTLSAFGEVMGTSSRVEVWMRSSSDSVMSLLKVTDSSQKHEVYGIDLNTAPGGGHMKGCALFTLRDATGVELIASQASHDLCDDKWHELVWEVHKGNTFTVKIDGFTADLDYHTQPREGPASFIPFSQWVSLGAHNNRGVLQNHYRGFIRNLKISCADFESPHSGAVMTLLELAIDEGSGSTVTMDRTGSGNNGIVYDKGTKKKWATWLYVDLPESMSGESNDFAEMGSHANNKVELASVAVAQISNKKGLFQEKVIDLTDGISEIAFTREHIDIYRKQGAEDSEKTKQILHKIPPTCFVNIPHHDLALQVYDTCSTHSKREDLKYASIVHTLKMGDGLCEVFDLKGFCPRTRSVWDGSRDEWVEPFHMMNSEEKHLFFANKKARLTEKALLKFGRSPRIFKNAKQKLDGVGFKESFAGTLLEGSLCAGPETCLYFLCVESSNVSEDARLAAKCFVEGQKLSTQHYAAIVMQKAVRVWLAKRKHKNAACKKDQMIKLREHKKLLRETEPDVVCIREHKIAFLILAISMKDTRMASLTHLRHHANSMQRHLTNQGWEVRISEGSHSTIRNIDLEMKKLRTLISGKEHTVLVHFIGYAARDRPYHSWVTREEISTLLQNFEAPQREAVEKAENFDRNILITEQMEDMMDAEAAEEMRLQEEREVAEAEEKKKKKSKGGGDWVMSTSKKVDVVTLPPIASPRNSSPRASPRKKSAQREEALLRAEEGRRSRTPLPCIPSATPDVSHIPAVPTWSPEPHTYLLLATTPLEVSAENTLSVESLLSLQESELGVQCIISAECYAAPGSDSEGFCFLHSSTGEYNEWHGDASCQFFGHYLSKCFSGCYGAVSIKPLLKSEERKRLDAERYEMFCEAREEAAENGTTLPVNPVSEKGVSFASCRAYLLDKMQKRSMKVKKHTPASCEYVGDMVISDYVATFDKDANKIRPSGGVLSLSFNEEATSDHNSSSLRDKIIEVLNASFGSVKPRPYNMASASLVLTFDDHISRATPPYTFPSDWEEYIKRVTGENDVKYAVRASDVSTEFELQMWCADVEKSRNLIDEFSVKYRGNVNMELRPSVIPSQICFVPSRLAMVRHFGFETDFSTTQRIKKCFMSGNLTRLIDSGRLPARVTGFHVASPEEFNHMSTLHAKEVSDKKAAVQYKLDNPTDENEIRQKSIAKKRKSLMSGMF